MMDHLSLMSPGSNSVTHVISLNMSLLCLISNTISPPHPNLPPFAQVLITYAKYFLKIDKEVP